MVFGNGTKLKQGFGKLKEKYNEKAAERAAIKAEERRIRGEAFTKAKMAATRVRARREGRREALEGGRVRRTARAITTRGSAGAGNFAKLVGGKGFQPLGGFVAMQEDKGRKMGGDFSHLFDIKPGASQFSNDGKIKRKVKRRRKKKTGKTITIKLG